MSDWTATYGNKWLSLVRRRAIRGMLLHMGHRFCEDIDSFSSWRVTDGFTFILYKLSILDNNPNRK